MHGNVRLFGLQGFGTQYGSSEAGAQTVRDTATVAAAGISAAVPALLVAGSVAAGTTTAAAAGGATAAIGGLLTAAGASATVPFAGWIAAGGLALAAASIALVKVMRDKHQRAEDLVAQATALGFTDAAELPEFFLRVTGMSYDKQNEFGQKLQKQLQGKGIFAKAFKSNTKILEQLSVLGAAIAYQQAELRGNVPPPAPAVQQQIQQVAASSSFSIGGFTLDPKMLALGLLVVGGAAVLLGDDE